MATYRTMVDRAHWLGYCPVVWEPTRSVFAARFDVDGEIWELVVEIVGERAITDAAIGGYSHELRVTLPGVCSLMEVRDALRDGRGLN